MQSTLLVLVSSRTTDNPYPKLQKTICSEQEQESGKTETDTEEKKEDAGG